MKRFFIIASMAILAIGCQKTEIQNEVQNQIGFSTETGKQTRAIVDGTAYDVNQPFGVYAYGYQMETVTVEEEEVIRRKEGTTSSPMVNVEISYDDNDTESVVTDDAWRATGTVRYYWPNDPRTRLDFYAYSPAQPEEDAPTTANLAPHQKLTGTISHAETDGLKLTNYVHSNMYVDFMVAEPVVGATYSVPATGATAGEVPLSFGHKMTQVNFTVKLNAPLKANSTTEYENTYPNIDFAINSIVLNNIVSQSTYSYKNEFDTGTGAEATLAWTPAQTPVRSAYKVYPATKVAYTSQTDYPHSYGAPAIDNIVDSSADVEAEVVLRTDANGGKRMVGETKTTLTVNAANPGVSFNTTPVTMIPQTWSTDAPQSVTITYTISGVGVAKETVVKTFPITKNGYPTWDINKKITYTLTIGLNEITFEPSVSSWSDKGGNGSYYNPDNINPNASTESNI